MRLGPFLFLFLSATLFFQCQPTIEQADWGAYQGDKGVNQYANLTQINRSNVDQLEVAWTYNCGDADSLNRTQIQCNPLIIDGILYGSSPKLKYFALDAATGQEKWTFDPFSEQAYEQFGMGVNRGLAFWTDGQEKRLFVNADSYLYCLDAESGKPVSSFGQDGRIDLHDGLGRNVSNLFISSNTPGIVYKDKIIMGGRVSEALGAIPGHIRAYNVKTGAMEWIFHTIPQPGEFGYETWPEDAWKRIGGANAWAGMSLDEKRGIVYVPTGSAAYDFYGGDRIGENLFANCILALNANTGERIWHFQTVHHDLWDRDLPAPANLVTVKHQGKKRDAVAQITKSGYIFLLDRETGEPLFPIEEVPVPASDLEGEQAWPTQPIPTKPPPFGRNRISEEDLTQRTPQANLYAVTKWNQHREGAPFVPPSQEGTFIFPGFDGGGEWGGAAFDPKSGLLYINGSEMPWVIEMLAFNSETQTSLLAYGKSVYQTHCISCHGADLKGASVYTVPSLIGLKDRLQESDIVRQMKNGQGAMPSFAYLTDKQVEAVAAFLLEKEDRPIASVRPDWPYPYYMNGYKRFKDPDGYPAIMPPWGTLNAIDLNKGEISWKVTLGNHAELDTLGWGPTGTENYGGPVVTSGGLIFIAATMDEKIRAFDKESGEELWEALLPAAGFATPATYMIDGKQYLVVACGGGKLGKDSGDAYVAFALPD